ncbi:MAG: DUF6512 family protein [Bacilli bacterium]|nr:DUF6512 family protein [Bacilli bacterium]
MKKWFKKHLLEIVTITIVILVGTAMHFVTTYIPNETVVKILGVIFPINECSWEHMKMIWYPMLVAGIVLAIMKKDKKYFSAFVVGGLFSICLTIAGFAFTQSFTIVSKLFIDIPLFIICLVAGGILSFQLAKSEAMNKYFICFIVLAVLMTALIITLTYVHGEGFLFQDNSGLEGHHHHEH